VRLQRACVVTISGLYYCLQYEKSHTLLFVFLAVRVIVGFVLFLSSNREES
jgi:hypothetical protein